ncbi:uncharacterized protein J4E78_005389 [Alternaria triticimaculans]|uniref:uncharacterized protein n=1 Tax=Alternaria triticimaculans TaxID=297637 RepID=UPI0020C21BD4|nr:uncharacterized protein J4E78_005389 [Alternaria triticimaculans]KAI4660684.1 hypothetical protein J4E78_005389 [Alternaria triticimaculans]
MADPISIVGLALTVIQILRPAVQQLKDAYSNGGSIHQTLDELRADSEAVCDLIDNIHRVLSTPSFVAAVEEVQGASQVNLLECLQRALQSCEREAQRLSNFIYDLDISGATGRLRQGVLQFKLDRRSDDLQHIKRNFQDHKSSIQLAFTVVSTCKQMQVAERDALDAASLKAQISRLEVALEQIGKLLNERLAAPGDKEQTVMLDEMRELQHRSAKVRRRATMRLDQITSILEETQSSRPMVDRTRPPVPPRRAWKDHQKPPAGFRPPIDQSPASKVPSTPTTPRAEKRVASMPATPTPSTIPRVNALSPDTNKSASPVLPATRLSDMTTNGLQIDAEDFEERVLSLLSTASTQRMGTEKPYNDETILALGELLAMLGKHDWSVRPRLYLVLRMIKEVRAMNMLIVEGFKDIHFPFTEVDLTSSLKSAASRQNFLREQRFVLSSRSVDLLKRIDRRSGTFSKDRKKLLSFENEVHNLKRLSHHHLVKLLGYIGIIMEPVADLDLQQYLARDAWTTQDYVVLRGFVGCLCSALVYLHDNKCRHKDLKPSNILIKGEQVYIADFGLALDWTEAQRETTMGQPEAYTPAYIAPESEDEIFQTAVLSDGMSDEPTVINNTTTTSIGSDVTLQAPPPSIEKIVYTPLHVPDYLGHHSTGGVGQSHPIWLNVGNDANVPFCATPAAVTEDSYPRPTRASMEKTNDVDKARADIPEMQATKPKHIARDRTGKRTDHEHEAAHLRFVHIPKAAEPTNEEDSSTAISLAEAFAADDGAFEYHLALLREKNPNWRDEITGLIAAEALDKYGANVMLVASNFRDDSLARDVIEHALIVEPQIIHQRDVFNQTALHYSANRNRAGITKYLIKKGANATITNFRGQTAFHVAIHRRRLATYQILLRYLGAADINTKDDCGETSLHLACYHDAPTEFILSMLAAGADANVEDLSGNTPLTISEKIGNLEIADLLREYESDEPGLSPPPPPYQSTLSLARQPEPTGCTCDLCRLFQAVRKVDDLVPDLADCTCTYHLVRLSLKTLSDVNYIMSCLNCVAQISPPGPFTNPPSLPHGDDFAGMPLPPYPDHSYYDYIIDEWTIEDDTDRSPQDITAQALACLAQAGFKGKKSYRNEPEKALKWVISNNATTPYVYKIVEILLDCGASANTTDKTISLNQIFAVIALLDAGANIEAIGKAGAKPLAMALEGGNYGIITLLLDRGADVHSRANGMTCALFYAVQMGYVDIVSILLEDYGAKEDMHRTDFTGRSILHVLVYTHVDHMLHILDRLIEEGANVNAEDYSGSTPLHEAAKLGSTVMVSGLLEYGATMNVQDRQGKTPLDHAQAKKHREVVEYLGGTLKKKGWFRRS